jgi:hypothetical protein
MLHFDLERTVRALQLTRPTWPATELPALDDAMRAMLQAALHLKPAGGPEDDFFGPGPAPLAVLHGLELAHHQLDALRKLGMEHGAHTALERRTAASDATAVIRQVLEHLRALEPVRIAS